MSYRVFYAFKKFNFNSMNQQCGKYIVHAVKIIIMIPMSIVNIEYMKLVFYSWTECHPNCKILVEQQSLQLAQFVNNF